MSFCRLQEIKPRALKASGEQHGLDSVLRLKPVDGPSGPHAADGERLRGMRGG